MTTEKTAEVDRPTLPSRDARGRFAEGNKGGPGNPFHRRSAEMREAIQRAVSPEQLEQLMAKLLDMSLDGNLQAAKLVLQYVVGRPKPVVEPDRVDVDEWELKQESFIGADRYRPVTEDFPVGFANFSADAMTIIRTKEMEEAMFDKEKAAAFTKREIERREREREGFIDDSPLTPEELEEIAQAEERCQQWLAAQEAERARLGEAAAPSLDGFNGYLPPFYNPTGAGHRPSLDGVNGPATAGSPRPKEPRAK